VLVASAFFGPIVAVTLPWTWACLAVDALGISKHLPEMGDSALFVVFASATVIALALTAKRPVICVWVAIWLLINVAWGSALWISMIGFGLGP
jgi:hypothetical protein